MLVRNARDGAVKKKPGLLSNNYQVLRDLYYGENGFNHLWIGPSIPVESDPQGAKTDELRRVYREHNIIGELIDNWCDGLVSSPFNLTLRSRDGREETGEQALDMLRGWIEKVGRETSQVNPIASDFNRSDVWQNFVLSLGVYGRASFRLWQRTDDDLRLHVPLIDSVLTSYGDDTLIDQITYGSGMITETHKMLESGFMEVTTNQEEQVLTVDTKGLWFITTTTGDSLITPSVISKQAGLNHDLTMLTRNQLHSGFKRRTLLNAEMPMDDEPYAVGPGVDEYVPGIEQLRADGSRQLTNPSVHESQPFPVANFQQSIEIWTELLYREFRQSHLLVNSGAGVSGESLLQMRSALMVFLSRWKRRLESSFSDVLTLVLLLKGYENLEAIVDLNITTGPMSSEERKALIGEYQAGLLSRDTTLAILGSVSDPSSEVEKIEEELRGQTEPVELGNGIE